MAGLHENLKINSVISWRGPVRLQTAPTAPEGISFIRQVDARQRAALRRVNPRQSE